MEMKQNTGSNTISGALEAVLFAMGEPVEITTLAQALDTDIITIMDAAEELKKIYLDFARGITLIELDGRLQLCTKPEYYPNLIRIAATPEKPSLTNTLMETLAIVAYKQPVTKAEISKIRGVSSDHAVNRLVEFGLIEEAGRLNAPGRPILFATTEEFLRRFGMNSLDGLPDPETAGEKGSTKESAEDGQTTDDTAENQEVIDLFAMDEDHSDEDGESVIGIQDEEETEAAEGEVPENGVSAENDVVTESSGVFETVEEPESDSVFETVEEPESDRAFESAEEPESDRAFESAEEPESDTVSVSGVKPASASVLDRILESDEEFADLDLDAILFGKPSKVSEEAEEYSDEMVDRIFNDISDDDPDDFGDGSGDDETTSFRL